jgi:hypothetical protein
MREDPHCMEALTPSAPVRREPCPACGATIEVDARHPGWCADCGWGLHAPPTPEARGLRGRLAERAARRSDALTVARLAASDGLRPRRSATRAVAVAIALGVVLLWLGLAAAAIALVARAGSNPFADVLALVAAILFVVMRPRAGRMPGDGVISRTDAPELHTLVAAVAASLGSRPPDVIVLDATYNASWGTCGVRRRRVLTLGLPLLRCSSPTRSPR